jgi:hypothetical protein
MEYLLGWMGIQNLSFIFPLDDVKNYVPLPSRNEFNVDPSAY